MKQVLMRRGHIAVENVPAPLVEPGSVLVEVAYSVISTGTEMSSLKGTGQSILKMALEQRRVQGRPHTRSQGGVPWIP